MRTNSVRNATSEDSRTSVDLWNKIHYLDPDLQGAEREQISSDEMAIIIAIAFGLLLVSGLFLYVRTL